MSDIKRTIPGFTDDQSWSVEQVITRAVAEGVEQGIKAFQASNCSHHQERTKALERTIFGASEDGIRGIDSRVDNLEVFESRINRLTWMVMAELLAIIVIVVDIVLRVYV